MLLAVNGSKKHNGKHDKVGDAHAKWFLLLRCNAFAENWVEHYCICNIFHYL